MTYLASLGKAQTAAVKRDAEIGVAQVSNLRAGQDTAPRCVITKDVKNGRN